MNKEDYNFDPMTGEKVIKDDYNNLNNLILRGISQTIKSLLL